MSELEHLRKEMAVIDPCPTCALKAALRALFSNYTIIKPILHKFGFIDPLTQEEQDYDEFVEKLDKFEALVGK